MATIQAQEQIIYAHAKNASICSVSATFITLTALAVIGCAALCFTLPGVNTISQIVYPVICPAAGVLVLAIPSWIMAILASRKQTPLLKALITQAKEEIDANLPKMLGSERRDWIIDHLLSPHHGWFAGGKLISSLIKEYPDKEEKQGTQDKIILRALNQVQLKLLDESEQKEWDEKIIKAKETIDAGFATQPKDGMSKWLIKTLKDQEDEWEDEHCVKALRDLADTYCCNPYTPTQVTAIHSAIQFLGTSMY